MAHQSLDHNEILNVRWATNDPNPMAQARDKRRIEEQAAAAIRHALPAEFVAELEGKDKNAAKKRRIEGSFGLRGYEVPEEIWYARGPDAVNPAGRTVEGGENTLMIEQGAHTTVAGEKEEGGIISNEMMAALKGFQQSGARVTTRSENTGTGLSLVDYGSDSD
jgi:hypothetical protein